jgi:hypothetical protein
MAIFVVTLLYVLFFQQYVGAFIVRIVTSCLFPGTLSLSYKRLDFSPVSGSISLGGIEVVTQDLSIRIANLFGTLYY